MAKIINVRVVISLFICMYCTSLFPMFLMLERRFSFVLIYISNCKINFGSGCFILFPGGKCGYIQTADLYVFILLTVSVLFVSCTLGN